MMGLWNDIKKVVTVKKILKDNRKITTKIDDCISESYSLIDPENKWFKRNGEYSKFKKENK